MKWNEVASLKVEGEILVIKDAMIMLDEDEESPAWPSVPCEPGEYLFEIYAPSPFHAQRARIRAVQANPEMGKEIGVVDVDHGFIGVIDYDRSLSSVQRDYEEYSEWTGMELDDELAINFSGVIEFQSEKLLYVKAGDGDGSYTCYELVEDGNVVGIECVFEDTVAMSYRD